MALVACHECGQTMSTTATACPSCGAKPKREGNSANVWGPLVLVVLVLLLVAGIGGGRPDPLDEARQRDRRVLDLCLADMNDPVRSASHREAARFMCEKMRDSFIEKYKMEP